MKKMLKEKSKSIALSRETLWSLTKHLHYLDKSTVFLRKLCICSQTYCVPQDKFSICLQNICILLQILAFSCKSIAFPRYIFHLLAKHLGSLTKVLCSTVPRSNFVVAHKPHIISITKSFARKCKVSQVNTNILQANTTFLRAARTFCKRNAK